MMSWPLVLGAMSPYGTEDSDPYWDDVIFYAPFTEDLLDHSQTALAMTGGGALDADTPAAGLGSVSYKPATGTSGYRQGTLNADFGSGNFTIELFVKFTSGPTYCGIFSIDAVLGRDHPLISFGRYSTGVNACVWCSTNGTSWNISGWSGNMPNVCDGSWHHVAIVRSGETLMGFVDGALVLSATMSGTYTPKGQYLLVGGKADVLNESRVEHIQHFRVTKGVARYTAGFTPPVLPYPTA